MSTEQIPPAAFHSVFSCFFPQQLHTAASSSFVFLLYFRIFLPPVYQKTFLSSFLTQNRNQILLCPVDCNTSFPPFLLGMKGKSCALNAYTITISLYLFGTDSSVRLISTASSFGRSSTPSACRPVQSQEALVQIPCRRIADAHIQMNDAHLSLLHPTEQLFHQCTYRCRVFSLFSATQTFVISLSSKEIRIPRYPKISPSSSATRNSASSRIRNVKIRFLSTESKSWPPQSASPAPDHRSAFHGL